MPSSAPPEKNRMGLGRPRDELVCVLGRIGTTLGSWSPGCPRGRLITLMAIVGVIVASAPAAGAAVNTWAGVWDSDFGRLTLDAGGSGSYEGYSSGNGQRRAGHWQRGRGDVDSQPGNPPLKGTRRFTLSPGGRWFTGDWAYDSGGPVATLDSVRNGTCIEGHWLKMGTTTAAARRPAVGRPRTLTDAGGAARPGRELGETTSYKAPQPATTRETADARARAQTPRPRWPRSAQRAPPGPPGRRPRAGRRRGADARPAAGAAPGR